MSSQQNSITSNILDQDYLYHLLPRLYRRGNPGEADPLRALLGIMEGELKSLENEISGAYDNCFIETCEPWAIAYIAELLGIHGLHDTQLDLQTQRARIANTLRYRRRKGLASSMERIIHDVTGWHASAVEFFKLLVTTQHIQHYRPSQGGTVHIRDLEGMETLNSAFERNAHSLEISDRSQRHTRYQLPSIGLFLWRLQSYPIVKGLAKAIEDISGGYSFHPLGLAIPLFNQPQVLDDIAQQAKEIHLPVALRPAMLALDLQTYEQRYANLADELKPLNSDYYGPERSFHIVKLIGEQATPINHHEITVMDLEDWPQAPVNTLAVDVRGGRLAWGPGQEIALIDSVALDGGNSLIIIDLVAPLQNHYQADSLHIDAAVLDQAIDVVLSDPDNPQQLVYPGDALPDGLVAGLQLQITGLLDVSDLSLQVNYHYGFSADIGGGHYDRQNTLAVLDEDSLLISVSKQEEGAVATLQLAIDQCTDASESQCIIEIRDDATYDEPIAEIQLNGQRTLTIQAADGARPCIAVETLQCRADQSANTLILNGVLLAGKLEVQGQLQLVLHHCTLLPGIGAAKESLALSPLRQEDSTQLQVMVEKSIVGAISLPADILKLTVWDSIIDAAQDTAIAEDITQATPAAGPVIDLQRSTVLGSVWVSEVDLISESIITQAVVVERIQTGCVRYSSLPIAFQEEETLSRTPERYRTQPELDYLPAIEPFQDLQEEEFAQQQTLILASLTPRFVSTTYGQPGYAQLSDDTHEAIHNGAEDGAEMGVFKHLNQTQREASLQEIIEEYLPFGLEGKVFFEN
ncbi:MAG: hypothetical protein V3T17_10825 [Pseudomonadales bacterium]